MCVPFQQSIIAPVVALEFHVCECDNTTVFNEVILLPDFTLCKISMGNLGSVGELIKRVTPSHL